MMRMGTQLRLSSKNITTKTILLPSSEEMTTNQLLTTKQQMHQIPVMLPLDYEDLEDTEVVSSRKLI